MAKWDKRTSTILLINTTIAVIGMACFLTNNDALITAFSIMYGVLMFFTFAALIQCLRSPAKVAMSMGIVVGKDGKRTIDPKNWDKYIKLYRSRLKRMPFWISRFVSIVLITVFWVEGAYILFSMAVAAVVLGGISSYLIYKKVKSKKADWCTEEHTVGFEAIFGALAERKKKED